MKERKYLKQYRVNTQLDARGRTHSTAEYIGAYYAFPDGTRNARQRTLWLLPLLALWWGLALIYLKTARVTGRCMYALLPLGMALMPSGYALIGLFDAYFAPEQMTLPQREQSFGRIVRASAGAGVLSLVGMLGCAVRVTIAGAWPSAWHEALLPLGMVLLSGLTFRSSKRDMDEMQPTRRA